MSKVQAAHSLRFFLFFSSPVSELQYNSSVLQVCRVVDFKQKKLAAVLLTFRYQISCYSSDCAYFICIYKVCFGENSFCDLGLNDSLKYICKHI